MQITNGTITADPSRVQAIKNWPRPATITEMRGFLGLVNQLLPFVPRLSRHTSSLSSLTGGGRTNQNSIQLFGPMICCEILKQQRKHVRSLLHSGCLIQPRPQFCTQIGVKEPLVAGSDNHVIIRSQIQKR